MRHPNQKTEIKERETDEYKPEDHGDAESKTDSFLGVELENKLKKFNDDNMPVVKPSHNADPGMSTEGYSTDEERSI